MTDTTYYINGKPLDQLTAEELQGAITWFDQESDMLKKQWDDANANKARMQAELDRRALEAYWAAHPKLIRLEVGDKLLINEAFHDYKKGILPLREIEFDLEHAWKLGTVYQVRLADPKTNKGGIEVPNVGGTSCPYKIMVSMRKAWLAQEKQS